MNHGLKALLLAASTIITCIVVGLGFQMAEEAKRLGNYVIEDMYRYRTAIEEQNIMKYDGVTVYGADVVNLMKQELADKENGFSVVVSDGRISYFYEVWEDIGKAQEPGMEQFILPAAEFVGEVKRNENGVIIQVIFRKKNREDEEL